MRRTVALAFFVFGVFLLGGPILVAVAALLGHDVDVGGGPGRTFIDVIAGVSCLWIARRDLRGVNVERTAST